MPSLTYIGQTPVEGTGSPVIILRHLQRLAANGWKITVIGENGNDPSLCEAAGWPVRNFPLRRPWWPPYRSDSRFSRFLRTSLLARECKDLTRHDPPDAILGYLAAHADFSAEIAARYSRLSGVPLTLLVHDDAAAFAKNETDRETLRRRHSAIIRKSHRCWFVSPGLAGAYDVPASDHRVLAPIPAGWERPAQWTPEMKDVPKIYYAGFIWPAQYPLLGKIAHVFQKNGARLVLQTRDTPDLQAFLSEFPADWIPPFETNRQALEHLVTSAAAVLVSYTETLDEMPWIATSYPSKFIEYSHLGLPCAIVAPPESSIGHWATDRQFPDFFPPDRLADLAAWCEDLLLPQQWEKHAAHMRNLADNEFSPAMIHRQFEENLAP